MTKMAMIFQNLGHSKMKLDLHLLDWWFGDNPSDRVMEGYRRSAQIDTRTGKPMRESFPPYYDIDIFTVGDLLKELSDVPKEKRVSIVNDCAGHYFLRVYYSKGEPKKEKSK